MCGIFGLAHFDGTPTDEHHLAEANRLLAHRGPDASGVWASDGFGLAHRRLSIIDISGSQQPMLDAGGQIAVVFNGEIYNYRDLRRDLEAAGHAFATQGDTEVLLHGWRQYGADLPRHLRGMFAFAIVDLPRRLIFLARDRLGKKPLYYRHDPHACNGQGRLTFASEIKALIPGGCAESDIDPDALRAYLTHQYVPGEATMLRGVRRLLPGHCATAGPRSFACSRYHAVQYEPKDELTFDEAREGLEAALRDAVRVRLESEVPLGCFLSGGLDSSAVAWCMAREMPGRLQTFSIGFREATHDESPHARRVAEILGTEHHEWRVKIDALENMGRLAWHLDDLMGDPSALPQYELARQTRHHVAVALSGDGGDESLAGYARHLRTPSRMRWPQRMLVPLAPAGAAWLHHFPPRHFRAAHRADLIAAIAAGRDAFYLAQMTLFGPQRQRMVLSPELPAPQVAWSHAGQAAMDAGGARDALDRLLSSDLHTYLPGDLLPKVDRTSMAVGLEVRCPFLDQHFVQFAARIPARLKLGNSRTPELKSLLKAMLRPVFPPEIVDRPKQGFAVPVDAWFRQRRGARHLRHLLRGDDARSRPFLDPRGIDDLLREHERRGGHGHRLYMLAMFEIWCRTFFSSRPEPATLLMED